MIKLGYNRNGIKKGQKKIEKKYRTRNTKKFRNTEECKGDTQDKKSIQWR